VAWPQPTDYNEAIQNPRLCFSDSELQGGQVVEDALGMPRPYSGNFADVYQVRDTDGRAWAVKCFTRDVPTLQGRYQAISDHLRGGSPSFMVRFQYQGEGIRIRGRGYPILKMDWVEGFTLNEFVRKHADKPKVMFKLARLWVKLSLQLRQANMAHADLQHGNVLLVPGEKTSQLSLRLIDYDGMHVPALARSPSGEIGHPNYQHPQRLREGLYNPEVDRFPHLVIYTALRCLIVGGRELWAKYDNGENLLFREQDFHRPQESALLLDAWQLPDPDLRRLIGHLLVASQLPLEKVPLLDEVVGREGRPLGLTPGQERQVLDHLPPTAARMKAAPVLTSRFSLEELIADTDDDGAPAAVPGPESGPPATEGEAALMPAGPAPRRRTAVVVPTRSSGAEPCATILPWLQAPCLRCGARKHLLEPVCPHCRQVDFGVLVVVVVVTLFGGVAAAVGLPRCQPDAAGLFGLFGAVGCLAAAPLAAALMVRIATATRAQANGAEAGPHWPAREEVCPRCGRLQILPLFVCRNCGRMAWPRLAAVAAAVLVVLALVGLSQPHPEAAGWWEVLLAAARVVGRLVGLAGGLLLTAGLVEVWKLQGRLPAEGRLRHPAARLALLAATLVPLVATVLLVLGLFAGSGPPELAGPGGRVAN
jgi:hypothetical protein